MLNDCTCRLSTMPTNIDIPEIIIIENTFLFEIFFFSFVSVFVVVVVVVGLWSSSTSSFFILFRSFRRVSFVVRRFIVLLFGHSSKSEWKRRRRRNSWRKWSEKKTVAAFIIEHTPRVSLVYGLWIHCFKKPKNTVCLRVCIDVNTDRIQKR